MSSWSSDWKASASSSSGVAAPAPNAASMAAQQSAAPTSFQSSSSSSSGGGFASNWQAVAKISTTDIVKQLRVFTTILQSTRQPDAFIRWNRATIEKAFKWADTVKTLCSAADDVQLRSIRDNHMQPLHISLVDNNQLLLLEEPVEMLLRCAVSSPTLPHLGGATAAQLLLSEVLSQASNRIGRARAIQIASECVSDALVFRMALLRTVGNSSSSRDISDEELPEDPSPDLSLLAFELLLTCYKLSSLGGAKASAAEAKVAAAAARDEPTLHLLCRALALSPWQCAAALDIRNPPGSAAAGEPEGSWGLSLSEDMSFLRRLRDFQLSAQAIFLWRAVEAAAEADVAQLMRIDGESAVLRRLLGQRQELRRVFLAAVLRATSQSEEKGVGGGREMLEEVCSWGDLVLADEECGRALLRLRPERRSP